MEKLEKYTVEAIVNTLRKCSGIYICILSQNAAMSSQLMDDIFKLCKNELETYFSNKLRLKNGSEVFFASYLSGYTNLCGARCNQIFINGEVTEEFLETMVRPLISSYPNRNGAIFKNGVFQLFDELDETKRLASSIIYELQEARSLKDVRESLDKGLAAIKHEYAN